MIRHLVGNDYDWRLVRFMTKSNMTMMATAIVMGCGAMKGRQVSRINCRTQKTQDEEEVGDDNVSHCDDGGSYAVDGDEI